MKKIFLLKLCSLIGIFITSSLMAQQTLAPVKWQTKLETLGEQEYVVKFSAHLDKGYYIYSVEMPEGGPLPTAFDFSKAKQLTVLGKTEEVSEHIKEGYDQMFEMDVRKFAEEVTFVTKVKLNSTKGTCQIPVDYMVCNEKSCIKLDDNLEVLLTPTPAIKTMD
ncbi:MAG: hypothetical protein JNM36_03310 [Chitinophagales bacterium]|nr:hypothetical protein [Chitinophagales bacterium]